MKSIRILQVFLLLIPVLLVGYSCQKEFLCDNCGKTNIPPVASAGKDTIILLPADSAILNGENSMDPDGTIKTFKWTQVEGPDQSKIQSDAAARTRAQSLKKGTYLFQLKVTDNGGLTATDTMQVIVTDINHPPVADAGPDRTATLPRDTLQLDGSASSDPENNIISYKWRKLSGYVTTYIYFTEREKTIAYDVEEDTYAFELTVTDAGGLFSKDTVIIKIAPEVFVTGHLQDITNQIQPRYYPTGAAIGDKVIFAGGSQGPGFLSRVDIFDTKTNTHTTAELSIPRMHMAAVTSGDKVYFAGGVTTNQAVTTRIDIYDAKTNTWSTAELSEARYFISGETAGDKIVFAGGCSDANVGTCSRTADILDLRSNTWSDNRMMERGFATTAVAYGSKVYFAGGDGDCRRKAIDVFDAVTNTWSSLPLGEPRAYISSATAADNLYWGGGYLQSPSATIEILNVVTTEKSFRKMSSPIAGFKAKALVHDNNILFFSGDGVTRVYFNQFEIGTGKSTEGRLDHSVFGAEFVSLKNKIYMAGGIINGSDNDRIWTLTF